ncbi:MAG: hypothetical protein AVDCRST_MAG87-1100 [uncultured Thermomicrobiales bacterium]|uniref:Uncharacterized protein n=1 Tax=uncultured Thermomicrobiales bacterium TaxID=1645740 RepID=A0A6J4UNY4_9BACT|nr:MAG: hypothetical protein AVDCRST_MAG87-1100 [uncultured Thermomicrobiales bacterium]
MGAGEGLDEAGMLWGTDDREVTVPPLTPLSSRTIPLEPVS